MTDPAADPARAALQPLAAEIRKLRAAKWTYVRIAGELGISATAVSSIAKVLPPPVSANMQPVVLTPTIHIDGARVS